MDETIEMLSEPTAPTAGQKSSISPEWQVKNLRRGELIDRKCHGSGLTKEEETELADLQTGFSAYLRTLYPRPKLDWETLERLEARLRASESHQS